VAVAISVTLWPRPDSPHPAPPPLDLSTAFDGPDAPQDAALVAAMCREIAEVIRYDGKLDSPVLKSAAQLDALRSMTREFLIKGKSFGEKYPRLRQIVGDYLSSELGNSNEEVTEGVRQKWIDAYSVIAESAEHVVR